MDIDLLKSKIEGDIKAALAWEQDPYTQAMLKAADEQSEVLLDTLLEQPVVNLETFFAREQAFGHLRGLRHVKQYVKGIREELQEKLNEIPR